MRCEACGKADAGSVYLGDRQVHVCVASTWPAKPIKACLAKVAVKAIECCQRCGDEVLPAGRGKLPKVWGLCASCLKGVDSINRAEERLVLDRQRREVAAQGSSCWVEVSGGAKDIIVRLFPSRRERRYFGGIEVLASEEQAKALQDLDDRIGERWSTAHQQGFVEGEKSGGDLLRKLRDDELSWTAYEGAQAKR